MRADAWQAINVYDMIDLQTNPTRKLCRSMNNPTRKTKFVISLIELKEGLPRRKCGSGGLIYCDFVVVVERGAYPRAAEHLGPIAV